MNLFQICIFFFISLTSGVKTQNSKGTSEQGKYLMARIVNNLMEELQKNFVNDMFLNQIAQNEAERQSRQGRLEASNLVINANYFGQSFKYSNGYKTICYNNFIKSSISSINTEKTKINLKKCSGFNIDWNRVIALGYGSAFDSKGDLYGVILFKTNQRQSTPLNVFVSKPKIVLTTKKPINKSKLVLSSGEKGIINIGIANIYQSGLVG